MSSAKVDAIYGEPTRVVDLDHGVSARLYGNKSEIESLEVNPQILACPVAVVFRGNRVIRILTYGFFDSRWED